MRKWNKVRIYFRNWKAKNCFKILTSVLFLQNAEDGKYAHLNCEAVLYLRFNSGMMISILKVIILTENEVFVKSLINLLLDVKN